MSGKNSSPENKQQAAFYLLIITGLGLFYLLYDYFVPFLGALIFYIMFRGLMIKLVEKKGWKKGIAALFIMVISLVLIIVPLILFFHLLYGKLSTILDDPSSLINALHTIDIKIKSSIGIEIVSDENMANIKTLLGNLIPGVINKVANITASLLFMYFILYFLLANYKAFFNFLESFSPFEKDTNRIFKKELFAITLSNVIVTPILAILQGIAAIIAFYFMHLPDFVFWGCMCGIFSFMPMIGSAAIWLPVAIYFFGIGENSFGIIMLVYGVLVIANIDNVVRMFLQKKFANVHPLITVFGVLIGLHLFGVPGLVFGPLLLSFFVLGVQIYRKNYVLPSDPVQEKGDN